TSNDCRTRVPSPTPSSSYVQRVQSDGLTVSKTYRRGRSTSTTRQGRDQRIHRTRLLPMKRAPTTGSLAAESHRPVRHSPLHSPILVGSARTLQTASGEAGSSSSTVHSRGNLIGVAPRPPPRTAGAGRPPACRPTAPST